MDAGLLAQLPAVTDASDSFIAEIIGWFRTWTKPQWVKILKMAAHIVEEVRKPLQSSIRGFGGAIRFSVDTGGAQLKCAVLQAKIRRHRSCK